MSSNNYCISIENLNDLREPNTCPWIGRTVYHVHAVNDVINKISIIFVCLMYLFCILTYVYHRKLNK